MTPDTPEMTTDDDGAAARPDEENPQWTREEISTARPALAAIADLFSEQEADAIRQRDAGKNTKREA